MKNVDFRFSMRGQCCAGLATVLTASAAHAAVIVVPSQQPTIQAAINAASSGDTVLVLNGTYSGVGNFNIDFLGKNITLQSQNGPANTVIDIQATPTSQRGGFSLHSGENNSAVISGFTIKRGLQFNGPAMMVTNASPTVRNCVFTENHANCWGGVLYFDGGSSPTFTDCKFVNNYSADDGGVVFGFEGSPRFTNCLFAGNTAPSLAGAILTYGTDDAPRLSNCTITGNHGSLGAAIYSNNLVIENSIIWDNTGDDQQIYTFTPTTVSVRFSNVQGGFAGVGNTNVQPQFANPSAGDFHLMPGSPLIDAGDPATVVVAGTTDVVGDTRPFGFHIDMGIDEFRKAGDVNVDHMTNVDDLLAVISA